MNKKYLLIIGTIVIGLGIGTVIGLQQVKDSETIAALQGENQEELLKSQIEDLKNEQKEKLDKITEQERAEGCFAESIPNCEDMPQILVVLKGKEKLIGEKWREENNGFETMEYTSAKNAVFTFFIPPSRTGDEEAVERIKQDLDKGGKYEADPNMTYAEDTCRYGDQIRKRREMLESNETCKELNEQMEATRKEYKDKIDECRKQLDLLTARPEEERQKAMEAIKEFRENPELELAYIHTYSHPTQLGIGKIISQDENTTGMETPEEYQMPVEIYQEKEPIGGGCEIYEYEIDIETNKVLQMRMVYPEGYNDLEMNEVEKEKCDKTSEFLYRPLYTEAELEEIAMDFLRKHVENFEEIKDEFVYRPSTANPETIASQRFWRWTGEKPEVPEGWMVDMPPVINLLLSCSGEILQYGDNTDCFRIIDKIK